MKVALLGNMNNNHFALSRYLRDKGIDAELLLFENELDHFAPACDTYSLDFMTFSRRLTWGASTSFLRTRADTIAADVDGYDLLIGCGLAPAYLHKIGRPLDIFIPYGGDMWVETQYRLVAPHRLASVWSAVHAQRAALPRVGVFLMAATNELYESQWQRYRGASERWYDGIPLIYAEEYQSGNLDRIAERSHWGHYFKAIRNRSELMVMSHTRHCWMGDQSSPDAKGTDRLLRGWAMFRHRNPKVRANLVTLEYGPDVAASRQLIEELGIADSVVWLPKMYRKDLMVGLMLADIVAAEFIHSWTTGGVLFEGLVAGKPVMAWRDDTLRGQIHEATYDIMNARSAEDIAGQLQNYIDHPQRYRAMGTAGRRWYEQEVGQKSVAHLVDFISARAETRKKPDLE